ncbi:MAG: hypothetical protein KF823_11210 [Xanthomonadales bacterium]|nr:hypothetical protein [Xanthomonadales bacterium]
MTRTRSSTPASAAAWLAAALGAAAFLAVFWPGFMSPDSAEQLDQARTGAWTSVHPPAMAWSWALTDRLLPGPAGLFLVHTLLLWGALAWLSTGLFRRPAAQITFVLVLGLSPPVLATAMHLWKDVPMAAFAVLALAALVHAGHRPSGRSRLGLLALALLALVLACAWRHNAIALVPPLGWYVAVLAGVTGPVRRALAALALTAVVALAAALPNRHPAVAQRAVWPVIAVWDLAAVSIAEDEMRIPADWRHPDLQVATLAAAFTPWSNTPIFDTGQLLISLYQPPDPARLASLRSAWLATWLDHPAAMAGHRLRLARLLFGLAPAARPVGLVLSPGMVQPGHGPPAHLPDNRLRDRIVRGLARLAATPVFALWPYALVALLATLARRRRHPLAWPLLASAGLFCAPLLLAAPSAEFRYLLWPVLACLVVAVLPATGPRAAIPAPAG